MHDLFNFEGFWIIILFFRILIWLFLLTQYIFITRFYAMFLMSSIFQNRWLMKEEEIAWW